jgi:type I restriction enzyme S subunit
MCFPSKLDQTQIAAYLDYKTGLIDSIISQKEDLIKKLKEQRQAIINEAVTKGINLNVVLKDSNIEWLGQVPEHWKVMTFRRICDLQQGLQIPISERFFEEVEGALEYITTKSIHNPNDYRQYVVGAKKNVICSEDDVLLGRTGNTGEVVTGISGVFHNNFFKVDYDKNRIEKNFIVYFLKTTLIQELIMLVAGTTTIPDLNHGDFLNLPFLLPSLEEQKEILKALEAGLLVNDMSSSVTFESIQKLKEYRQSLISEAVTGKVDVRDWQAPKS